MLEFLHCIRLQFITRLLWKGYIHQIACQIFHHIQIIFGLKTIKIDKCYTRAICILKLLEHNLILLLWDVNGLLGENFFY